VKVYCCQTKQPKPIRAEACVGIPEVIAGQVDVLPADRREMGEQRIRNRLALPAQNIEHPAEIHRVPERDGGGDEGQPTGPILPCHDSAIAQAAEAMEADGTGKRVARLALVQLSRGLAPEFRRDPSQDYFSDGITENVISALGRFSNLFVAAKSASFQFKGRNLSPTEIGHLLDARYLLEGSLRRSGDRIRVNVELTEAEPGGTCRRELTHVNAYYEALPRAPDRCDAAAGDRRDYRCCAHLVLARN